MLTLALLTALTWHAGPPVDTAAVYGAVLQEIRAEYPADRVVLSETWSDVACLPLCGDPGNRQEHSAKTLRALRTRGLIEGTCRVPPNMLGCASYPEYGSEHPYMFVALGEIEKSNPKGEPRGAPANGGVWVLGVTIRGCADERCRTPDASGYKYLVQRDKHGAWIVVWRRPDWIA